MTQSFSVNLRLIKYITQVVAPKLHKRNAERLIFLLGFTLLKSLQIKIGFLLLCNTYSLIPNTNFILHKLCYRQLIFKLSFF